MHAMATVIIVRNCKIIIIAFLKASNSLDKVVNCFCNLLNCLADTLSELELEVEFLLDLSDLPELESLSLAAALASLL